MRQIHLLYCEVINFHLWLFCVCHNETHSGYVKWAILHFFYSIRLRTNDVVLTIAWTSLVFPTLRVTFKTSLSFNGKIKWIRICREASLLPRGMFEIFPLQYFNAVLTSLLNEVGHWPAIVISHIPCFLMSSYKKISLVCI